jgi:2-polyprenyl-6-methoxyphenol hydroxylase-like FAD-dependent oxidoreductase
MGLIGIAGGGIGGLTLAVALQKQGVEVLVLERQSEIRDRGAGISLWPNALAALDAVGLGEVVRSLGRSLAEGGERKLDGGVAFTFSRRSFQAALGEGLVCVDRGDLVRALAARLRPGTVRTDCTVAGYTLNPSGVTIRLHNGGDVAVDAVVGADGIGSAIATQLVGPLQSSYSGYAAWRAIAETDSEPEDDQFWACLADGHEFGWLPIGNNRTYWFATACLPEGHSFPEGDEAYLKDAFGHWPHPIPHLLAATPSHQLACNDIVDRAMPDKWSDGPVTLLGDAAHPMRPHLGQGGCQAIEDAAVLTFCLAKSQDVGDAFAQYEQRRRRRTRMIVQLSRHSGFTRPPGPLTTVFDRMTASVPHLPIGPAIGAISPIAGYRAGQRAVREF